MLSISTTESVMRTMGLTFNTWGADPRDADAVNVWQAQLRKAGLTDDSAAQRINRFCFSWSGSQKPTLHDICAYLRETKLQPSQARVTFSKPGSAEWDRESAAIGRMRALLTAARTVSAQPGKARADEGEVDDVDLDEIPF